MLFNSLSFVVFLVIVLGLYYSKIFSWTNKKRLLLFSSYVFYGLWNPPLIVLLWISTVVDWTAGKKLAVIENQRKRKLWLLLSLCVNLGFLAFFKYGNFLLENFKSLQVQCRWKALFFCNTCQWYKTWFEMYKRRFPWEELCPWVSVENPILLHWLRT